MPYTVYLNQVISSYPYTYESSPENDDAYLREEQCDCTLDQFDDNDI
ncbi:MAG: hypothetical protein ACI33P_11225 [Lysinibacillus sp.]